MLVVDDRDANEDADEVTTDLVRTLIFDLSDAPPMRALRPLGSLTATPLVSSVGHGREAWSAELGLLRTLLGSEAPEARRSGASDYKRTLNHDLRSRPIQIVVVKPYWAIVNLCLSSAALAVAICLIVFGGDLLWVGFLVIFGCALGGASLGQLIQAPSASALDPSIGKG